jgi:preprotein translocase subunit SecA
LFGRCARQGEPGTTEALVSLEDDLFVRYAPELRAVVRRLNGARQPVSPWLLNLLVTYAQVIAERRNAAIRMSTLKQDRKLQSMLAFSGVPN